MFALPGRIASHQSFIGCAKFELVGWLGLVVELLLLLLIRAMVHCLLRSYIGLDAESERRKHVTSRAPCLVVVRARMVV